MSADLGKREPEALSLAALFLDVAPDEVERGIASEFRKRPPADDPAEAAAVAMIPVRPVLEAKDAEIARLREELAYASDRPSELVIRAHERKRIAALLRHEADELQSGALLPLPGSPLSLADFARETADQLEAGTAPAENITKEK